MSEQKLQAKIIDYLKSEGFDVVKIIRCNRNGVSDILACSPSGRFWAIEVKWGSNTASPLQSHYINEITKRRGIAAVVYSLDEVKSLVLAN